MKHLVLDPIQEWQADYACLKVCFPPLPCQQPSPVIWSAQLQCFMECFSISSPLNFDRLGFG